MKQIRNLVNGLVAGGLALAMVSTLAAQTPEQVNATVVRVKGSARYTTGNNVWQPLKVGSFTITRMSKASPSSASVWGINP